MDIHIRSCSLLLKKKVLRSLLLIMDFPSVRYLFELLMLEMANVYKVYIGKVLDMKRLLAPFCSLWIGRNVRAGKCCWNITDA